MEIDEKFLDKNLAIIYVAGFFDGEGCILVSTDGKKFVGRPNNHRPRVTIGQKHKAPLILLEYHWGGMILKKKNRGYGGYEWVLCGQKAIDFIDDIKEFLILKKEQAELFCTFPMNPKRKGGKGKTGSMPDSVWDYREMVRVKLQEMKRAVVS